MAAGGGNRGAMRALLRLVVWLLRKLRLPAFAIGHVLVRINRALMLIVKQGTSFTLPCFVAGAGALLARRCSEWFARRLPLSLVRAGDVEVIGTPLALVPGDHTSASRIFDWLYLGGRAAANDDSLLKAMNVGYVLNCCQHLPFATEETRNLKLGLNDLPTQVLAPSLTKAFEFLEEARWSGKCCLIHCRHGVSRSVAIVLAYMVCKFHWRLIDAWNFLHARRPIAHPNHGFVQQLLDLELVVLGSHSALPLDFRRRALRQELQGRRCGDNGNKGRRQPVRVRGAKALEAIRRIF